MTRCSCLTSLQENAAQNHVRYYFAATVIQTMDNNKCWWGCGNVTGLWDSRLTELKSESRRPKRVKWKFMKWRWEQKGASKLSRARVVLNGLPLRGFRPVFYWRLDQQACGLEVLAPSWSELGQLITPLMADFFRFWSFSVITLTPPKKNAP